MKRTIIPFVALLVGALAGCGSDSNNNTNKCAAVTCTGGQTCDPNTGMCVGGTVDKCAGVSCTGGKTCNASTGMCMNPPMPALGALIDRMGRPGVNTALTNPFDFYKPGGNAQTSDQTKDAYNADANPVNWLTAWVAPIQLHLGIYDALDNTCGNQAAYALGGNYTTLATVLAGDALQLDTSKTTCDKYLDVELTLGATNTSCGGRTLTMDVIDSTFTALASGGATAVTDGINAPAKAPTTTFPYMADPM